MLPVGFSAIQSAVKNRSHIELSIAQRNPVLRGLRSRFRERADFSSSPSVDPSPTAELSEKVPRVRTYGRLVRDPTQLLFPFVGREQEAAQFLDGINPSNDDGLLAQWSYTLDHWTKNPGTPLDKQKRALFACAGGPGFGKSRMLQDLLQEEIIPLVEKRLASRAKLPPETRSALSSLSECLRHRLITVCVTFGNGSYGGDLHLPVRDRLTLRVQHALSAQQIPFPTWVASRVDKRIPPLSDVISEAVDNHLARNLIKNCALQKPVIFHLCVDEFNHVQSELRDLVLEIMSAVLVPANRPVFVVPFLGGLLRQELSQAVSQSTARCINILPRLARVEATYDAFGSLPEYKDFIHSSDELRKSITFFGGHWRSLEQLQSAFRKRLKEGSTMNNMPWTTIVNYVQENIRAPELWATAPPSLVRDIVWRYRTPSVSESEYMKLDALGVIQVNHGNLVTAPLNCVEIFLDIARRTGPISRFFSPESQIRTWQNWEDFVTLFEALKKTVGYDYPFPSFEAHDLFPSAMMNESTRLLLHRMSLAFSRPGRAYCYDLVHRFPDKRLQDPYVDVFEGSAVGRTPWRSPYAVFKNAPGALVDTYSYWPTERGAGFHVFGQVKYSEKRPGSVVLTMAVIQRELVKAQRAFDAIQRTGSSNPNEPDRWVLVLYARRGVKKEVQPDLLPDNVVLIGPDQMEGYYGPFARLIPFFDWDTRDKPLKVRRGTQ